MTFTKIALLVVLPLASALNAPQQFVRKLEPDQDLKSQVQVLVSRSNNDHARSLLNACPVCLAADGTDDDETEATGGFVKTLLGNVKDMVGGGTAISTLKDALASSTAGALGQEISVETLVPILITSANQFTAVWQSTQQRTGPEAADTAVSADTADLVVAIFDLLENIVLAIADLLYAIIDLINDIAVAIVGLVVDIILAILSLIESIKLAIIEIIVDFLNSITGNGAAFQADRANETLSGILNSGAAGGVFSNVIASLAEQGDESGLAGILTDSANSMRGLEPKLATFLDKAKTVSANSESTDVAVTEDTVVQILNLIVNIISSILFLVVAIITSVLNLVIGIIIAVIELIVGIIQAVLNLIISILNSILGIFSVQAYRVPTTTATLLGIMATILASPAAKIMACSLELPSCPETASTADLDCQLEALTCENKALATAAGSA